MARLLNDLYRLNLHKDGDLGLEKDAFIDKNIKKRTGLSKILESKNIKHWMLFLKARRNYIAHDGDMRQVPLVKERMPPLSEAEINQIVDEQTDWSLLATLLPKEAYEAYRVQAYEIARIKSNFNLVAKNVMVVPNDGGSVIWQPLISIDFDYKNFTKLMSKILENLNR